MVTGFDSNSHPSQQWACRYGLSISVEPATRRRGLILSLSGELDACNAQSLCDAVGGLDLDGDRTVVLDLSGLRFCDAAGVSAVLQINQFLRDRGGGLRVRGISGLPRRVFTLTGVDRVIELE